MSRVILNIYTTSGNKNSDNEDKKKFKSACGKYKKLCAAGKINFYYTHHDTLDKHQN